MFTSEITSSIFQDTKTHIYSCPPTPFGIPDIVREIFSFLSLSERDLLNFEFVCKGHLQSTSSAWHLFREKKGYLYDWDSSFFQTRFFSEEKKNYFLCQAVEEMMGAFPRKREIKKICRQLEPLCAKFPAFQLFIRDIHYIQSRKIYFSGPLPRQLNPHETRKIHNIKVNLPSAAPWEPSYKGEPILHTATALYYLVRCLYFGRAASCMPERPKELLNLSSQVISRGATFISRLSTTLIENHKQPDRAERYLSFLRTLARQAEEQGDFSGRKKLAEYAGKKVSLSG